jgi:hypothetical protein
MGRQRTAHAKEKVIRNTLTKLDSKRNCDSRVKRQRGISLLAKLTVLAGISK